MFTQKGVVHPLHQPTSYSRGALSLSCSSGATHQSHQRIATNVPSCARERQLQARIDSWNLFNVTSAARQTRHRQVDESIKATSVNESIESNMAKLMTKVEAALEKGKALGKVYSHRSNTVPLIGNPPNISTSCSTTFSLIVLFQLHKPSATSSTRHTHHHGRLT